MIEVLSLDDQVAIVTGGGAGIGRATAVVLAEHGAIVTVAERDIEAGRDTVEEITASGRRAVNATVDLSDVAQIRRLIADTKNDFARFDILVNNAAVTRSSSFFEVTEEEWDLINATNARGLFFCMQEAARVMASQGQGRIINISSIAGKGWGGSSSAAYAASKGAVLALTRYAAAALAGDGINVNAVCPGITETATFEQVVGDRAREAGIPYDKYVERYAQQVPLKRMNDPSDVANAVLFLASQAGRNITGQSLNVDGGLVFD